MSEDKMSGEESDKRDRRTSWPQPNRPYQEKAEDMRLWGILLFGLIGATATTLIVGHVRNTVDWVYSQMMRSQSSGRGSSFRSSFQEQAWKRYNRRMQQEYEEEMERVERIRRMQSIFNRERMKYKRGYDRWTENGGAGPYHQDFQRNDWYWKADTSYHRDQRANYREAPPDAATFPLSHHYAVLGLKRVRATPYTDNEIKTAFRAKAKEFHPDQHQDNKEAAEAKFKEVMMSYDAIKLERKNNKL